MHTSLQCFLAQPSRPQEQPTTYPDPGITAPTGSPSPLAPKEPQGTPSLTHISWGPTSGAQHVASLDFGEAEVRDHDLRVLEWCGIEEVFRLWHTGDQRKCQVSPGMAPGGWDKGLSLLKSPRPLVHRETGSGLGRRVRGQAP